MSPCPCCGCPDVYVADTAEGGKTVACPRCGMAGPESVDGDEGEAVAGWEFLCGRVCRNCRTVYIQRIKKLKAQLARKGGESIEFDEK